MVCLLLFVVCNVLCDDCGLWSSSFGARCLFGVVCHVLFDGAVGGLLLVADCCVGLCVLRYLFVVNCL